jgi:hypothetical protein
VRRAGRISGMDPGELPASGLVWRARSSDPFEVLKEEGVIVLGLPAAFLALAACCIAPKAPATYFSNAVAPILPAAMLAFLIVCLVDRRRVVEVSIAGIGRTVCLTVRRVNGTARTDPIETLDRVDIITHYRVDRRWITMRLHRVDGTERTRGGPETLPEGWFDVLARAGVRVAHKSVDDDATTGF